MKVSPSYLFSMNARFVGARGNIYAFGEKEVEILKNSTSTFLYYALSVLFTEYRNLEGIDIKVIRISHSVYYADTNVSCLHAAHIKEHALT